MCEYKPHHIILKLLYDVYWITDKGASHLYCLIADNLVSYARAATPHDRITHCSDIKTFPCHSDEFYCLGQFGLAKSDSVMPLTHWDRVTHICVSNLPTICSDNGLSPGRRQAMLSRPKCVSIQKVSRMKRWINNASHTVFSRYFFNDKPNTNVNIRV